MSEGQSSRHYLAPSAQRYAASTISSSSTATSPTTPTFPPNRELTPSPVPSTHSSINTVGSSQTQYTVRVNPTSGNRVSSRSRQSSKVVATTGMPGLGFPGTVRGVGPLPNGTSMRNDGGERGPMYAGFASRTHHAALPPLTVSELPTRTVNLANPLARSGRAPPSSATPVPMRGSHFITPSSMQPMHVLPSAGQTQYTKSTTNGPPERPIPPEAQSAVMSAELPPRTSISSRSVSARTVSQLQTGSTRSIANTEQAYNVATPRKPSFTNTSLVSASSSSGSGRLTSPPPPMPPPRDVPLPPLPSMPSNASVLENEARSASSSFGYDSGKARAMNGRQMASSEGIALGSASMTGSDTDLPRNRDVSAPAAMTSMPKGDRHELQQKGKKMSSPPLGGLFSRKAGKSASSLNSTGGSAPKARNSEAPSEFGVLPRGSSRQVESVPLAPPAKPYNSVLLEDQRTAGPQSLPVSNGKRSMPTLGLGRPSTAYLESRRSEEVNRHFSGGESSSDFAKSVQARKSSGGLRALFSRNKSKDRPDDRKTPSPVPPMPMRLPDTAPLATRRRASEDMLRSRKVEAGPQRVAQPFTNEKPRPQLLLNSVSDISPTRPPSTPPVSTPKLPEARSVTPQPPPSPPTPTAATSQEPSGIETRQPPLQRLPPTISLHLGDLPQLDLSLGSTFDSLMKSFEFGTRISPVATLKSPLSPQRPQVHIRRRSHSFSEYSHSSSGQSLTTRDTSARSNKRESRVNSSATLAADLAAYRALELPIPCTDVPPSMSSLSISEHGRTFSGTSSSVSEHSPPRTPRTTDGDPAAVYSSVSSESAETPHGDTSTEAHRVQLLNPLDRSSVSTSQDETPKAVRPSLLQQAESQRSVNPIIEQEETKPTERIVKPAESLSALGLAPPLEIVKSTSLLPSVKEDKRTRRIRLPRKSRRVQSQYTLTELAGEIRRILVAFKRASATKSADKAGLIRNELLDCLVEGEKKGFDPTDKAGNAAMRTVSIEWLNLLLVELKIDQPANERGACLEALSSIMESPVFSVRALENFPKDQAVFRSLMVRIMTYVLEKLSGKGVFHNTLMFAGRMLAFAFFRIEGVAVQLLSALPTKQAMLSRFVIALESFSPSDSSSTYSEIRYPSHLQILQFNNARSYITTLNHTVPVYDDPQEAQAFHFKPGNWLRRWQSDDSELFPAFYKAYHRQLARYLAPALKASEAHNAPLSIRVLMQAPGYVHLAAIFATKCQSYINGAVNAVTTTSANSSFTADESAGMRGNIKPPVLETANRRLSELILYLATSKLFIPSSMSTVLECDSIQLWANIIDIWIKYLISRTSLYSPKAVFCLFDLLDVIMMPPSPQLMSPDISTNNRFTLIDIRYLISVVKTILTETEHHLTLAKCVAFVWTHFDTLCYRVEDREALCLHILLDPVLFERLMLFWSQSVRSYVLRLVVFRLGHISTNASDYANHNVEVGVVQLLNASLEKIRSRHDELEPHLASDERGDCADAHIDQHEYAEKGMVRSRSTITLVDAMENHRSSEQEATSAEQLLGLAPASPNAEASSGEDEPEVIASKAKPKTPSWFKKSFGKAKKTKKAGPDDSDNESTTSSGRTSLDGQAPPYPKSILKSTMASTTPATPGPNGALFTKFSSDSITEPRGSFERDSPTSQRPSLTSSTGLQQGFQNRAPSPTSPVQRMFEFELPTASPRSDTFDRPTMPGSPSNLMASNPPKLPASPHMSRSFSKRSSLLHPAAVSAIDGPVNRAIRKSLVSVLREQPPYNQRLHPYCIRMLAELEDVRREYDEWWAPDGPGQQDNAPPRLNVAWPFSEDED